MAAWMLWFLLLTAPSWAAAKPSCVLAGERDQPCSSCAEDVPPQTLAALDAMMAAPAHRLWHRRWTEIRNSIDQELSVAGSTTVAHWRREGFVPEDAAAFAKAHAFSGALAGEDFLFMHRKMLKMGQRLLAARGMPCVAGWTRPPAAIDDPVWPAPQKPPRERTGEPAAVYWQHKLYWLRRNDAFLRRPDYLQAADLNTLGHDLEYYVHNVLHLVYSEPVSRCRSPEDASAACDDLMEAWSAPANKHFWKIHGYVDGFIGLWLGAHGYSEIAEDCGGRAGCYQWRGTWTGNDAMLAHR